MDRIFITVTKGSTEAILPGIPFTQEDFHGFKNDSRNNISNTHSIDSDLPRIVNLILNWARSIYGNSIGIEILSTKRTPVFNEIISTTGSQGSHVLGIAIDFAFTGIDSQNAWCSLKDEILDQKLNFQSWLNAGLGGVGIYGNYDKGRYFFHIDTRREGDGLTLHQSLGGKRYGLWTQGDLDCDLAKSIDEITSVDRQRNSTQLQSVKTFVEYIHPDTNDDLYLEDLISNQLFIGKDLTVEELLEVEKDSVSNHTRLFNNLTIQQKRSFNNGDKSYNKDARYPITSGTTLYIPFDKIDTTIEYESNFTSTKTSFNDFFPPIIKRLTTDPGYNNNIINSASSVNKIFPHARVFVWSRSRYLENGFKGGFIDITADCISINTTNTLQGGGDFSIETSGVSIAITESENGDISKIVRSNTTTELTKSNINKPLNNKDLGLGLRGEFIRSTSFYRKILFKNDLIFISYEKLNIDGKIEDVIENKWYDMIGLIDSVDEISSNIDLRSINIRGRSLVAVLMDDHSYFNPVSIGHSSAIYGGDPLSNGRYLDGSFQEFASILARSIRENIEFIFYRISSIGYVPNDVFSRFKNRTLIAKYTKNTQDGTVEEEKEARGVWQIMNLFIDNSISQLRLADSSISNPEGSILELILKTCQDPFVEFFTDTYGDRFYLIARKPPFEKKSLVEAVFQISDSVDESFNRFSIDSPNENESRNTYLEALQFEEEQGEGLKTVVTGEGSENSLLGVTGIRSLSFPKIINILESNVISDNLMYSPRGYAWYQLEEQGNFLGSKMGVGVIPALYFDEIAQVFGNRRLTVVSNYTSLNFYLDKNIDKNRNLYGEQVSQQLAFLVETNLHLPFTREGTITIDPDRRIKIGNYIYYRPTREIFYVTGVTNNFTVMNESIERSTTITVERGMEAAYINESPETIITPEGQEKDISVSYFNIIDLETLKDQIYDTVSRDTVDGKFNYKGVASVNTDVFNFFLQKRQLNK